MLRKLVFRDMPFRLCAHDPGHTGTLSKEPFCLIDDMVGQATLKGLAQNPLSNLFRTVNLTVQRNLHTEIDNPRVEERRAALHRICGVQSIQPLQRCVMSHINKLIDYTADLLFILSLPELTVISGKKLVRPLPGENAPGMWLDEPPGQEIGDCTMHAAFLVHLLVMDRQRQYLAYLLLTEYQDVMLQP
ncbi:MAG: hypothetical protein DDT24_00909 [Chloroflexi bacterium]|nr:hypothetical protein [Chloroflexota bacterium]